MPEIPKSLFPVFTLFLLCAPLEAQTVTGTILGLVTDTSGAVVPGAQVTASEINTGFARSTATDGTGNYVLPLLPLGTYKIAVRSTGFKEEIRSGIEVSADQRVRVDVSMAVGEISERVEVAAAAPLVEASDATVGQVVDTRQIERLPLNGRNFAQLIQLTAGVDPGRAGEVGGSTSIENFRGSFTFNANGLRSTTNNFMLDGIDDNESLFNAGGVVIEPVVDAIQEFKISTSNMSAEFGRVAGGVVSIQTRSGGNQLHGALFEFLRNSEFDANTFFNNASGATKPPFRHNQFGGTVGGPVILPHVYDGHNRTFFFADYQGFRVREGLTYLASVPAPAARQGDFSGKGYPAIYDPATAKPDGKGGVALDPFSANVIPPNRWDPVARSVLKFFPLPNTNPGATSLNFINNPARRRTDDQFDVRIDHRFRASDNFFARYSWGESHQLFPNDLFAPGNPFGGGGKGNDLIVRPQGLTLNYVHTFSAHVLSESRFGYSRLLFDGKPLGFADPAFDSVQIPNQRISDQVGVIPSFGISGLTSLGPQVNLPNLSAQNTFQFAQNLTIVKSRNTFKMGVDFIRRQRNNDFSMQAPGTISFNGAYTSRDARAGGLALADFLLGLPVTVTRTYLGGSFGRRNVEFSGFAQDDIKINRRLTLNVGLRYDLWTPIVEVADRQSNLDPSTKKLLVASDKGPLGRGLRHQDSTNFGPRIGWAYDLTGNGKTILRSAYGIIYLQDLSAGGTILAFNPPFSFTQQVNNATGAIPQSTLAAGFPPFVIPGVSDPSGVIRFIDPNYKSAYIQSWNLDVQREVAANLLFDVAYVASKGTRLLGRIDLNQPTPGAGAINPRRPYFTALPNLGQIDGLLSDVNSTYHSLQVKVEKRYAHGFSLLGTYTYGHAIEGSEGTVEIGTPGSGVPTMPQDIRNRRAEKALASFDMRQRVVVSYGWDLPLGQGVLRGGWRVQGITSLLGGNPVSVLMASSNLNTGSGSQRPDRICDGNLPRSRRSVDRYFDTGCFVAPGQFTPGNAGRNIIIAPGAVNFDASLAKDIPIRERARLEFRGEAFNLANTPQFWPPNTSLGPSSFGKLSATRPGSNRQIQFALKLIY